MVCGGGVVVCGGGVVGCGGVAVIGGATKALSRLHSWSVGLEFWIGRWCLDRNWICGYSLDLDCRRRRLLYITI